MQLRRKSQTGLGRRQTVPTLGFVRETVGVDIDVLDPELSAYLIGRCKTHSVNFVYVGSAWSRKTLLCYRVATPNQKDTDARFIFQRRC